MGSNKGFKSVIICVFILGLLLEQVQVEGKSCCKNSTARNCYNVCRLGGKVPRPACAATCGCKNVDGKCPKDYPKLHGLTDAGKSDTVEFCNIGCRSSFCDNLNNGNPVEEKEIDMEFCGSVCATYCNQITVGASVAAS